MTHDPMKSAAADAAATAAAFGARSNYAKGWEDAETQSLAQTKLLLEGYADSKDTLAHIRAEGARALETITSEAVKAIKERDDLDARLGHVLMLREAAESRIAIEASRADGLRTELNDVLLLMPVAEVPQVTFAGHHGEYVRACMDAALSQRDAAIARADAVVDCGQSEGCAISPPCCRHLTEQLDEMEAVAERWEARAEALQGDLTRVEMAHVVEVGKVAEAERVRDEWQARAKKAEVELDGARDDVTNLRNALQRDLDETVTHHRARRDAERSRDELGIQLAAQGERLRLAMAVVDAAREFTDDWPNTPRGAVIVRAENALAALDAVPGDALAPCSFPACGPACRRDCPPTSPAGVSGQPSGSTPAASSVTSSGLEVEGSRCGRSGTSPRETRGDFKRACDKLTSALDDAGLSPAGGAVIEVRDAMLAHLEALGIDTDNVKGGE